MKKILLIIDPQNDFIDSPNFNGSLAVPGSYKDIQRIVKYLEKESFEDIFVTMDTHSVYDIAHAAWWINSEGENPTPFTQIGVSEVENGVWKSVDPKMQDYSLFYVKELEKLNKHQLIIWPNHCIANTEGHAVNPELSIALQNWESENNKKINYIFKGTNPKTEHYSGLKAEVVLEEASETELNIDLINILNSYDVIEIAGEASSHCVANTALDLLENIPLENRNKVVLLKDCMSPVVGFEKVEKNLFQKIEELGAIFKITKNY